MHHQTLPAGNTKVTNTEIIYLLSFDQLMKCHQMNIRNKIFIMILSLIPHPMLLHGYQSEKYFAEHKEDIKQLFTFPEETKLKISKTLDALKLKTCLYHRVVGIHVRRGDYLQHLNIHPTCTIEYYKEAISKFRNSIFIVATDTPLWVKQNLCSDNVVLCNSPNELEDMYMLSQCDDIIISNSTFAWWGAYLGKEKQQVIAPKIWFGPAGPQDYYDIYNKGWIQI